MNKINKDLYMPLNEEFSKILSKYGTYRVRFSCTAKGFYVWYYIDDKIIANIPGYEKCKGSRRDPHPLFYIFRLTFSYDLLARKQYRMYDNKIVLTKKYRMDECQRV